MIRVHLDFETKGVLDLKVVGAARYARHPETDILCLAYAAHGEKPISFSARQIREGAFIPIVQSFLAAPGYMTAHNAFFEQNIYRHILVERYGYPPLDDPRFWDCTLARALACGFPAKLENLAVALELPVRKDMEGNKAMMKLSQPILIDPLGDAVFREEKDFPELFQSLYSYCCMDVEVEMAADARLPELSEAEHKVWELDQKINHRGVRLDVRTAAKAEQLAVAMMGPLNDRLREITTVEHTRKKGKNIITVVAPFVEKATQVQRIKTFLSDYCGLAVDSLDKHAISGLMNNPEIKNPAREIISIRGQANKSSVAKYSSMLEVADLRDERARGLIQYWGAATGRFAGRLFQPHNFPKGLELEGIVHVLNENLKVTTGRLKIYKEKEQTEIIAEVMAMNAAQFAAKYGIKAAGILGAILRGMIIASSGKTLVVADFAAIEARVLLWLAGDEAALDTFRRGGSLYLEMAEHLFKRKGITKKDETEYNLAKKIILGCGFQMGGPKFKMSCEQDGIYISEDLANVAVKAYREKHKPVVTLWYATQAAAIAAIREPGTLHKCAGGRIAYGMTKDRQFLACRLPSGRLLRYYRPTLQQVESPWGEKTEIRYWCADVKGGLGQFKTYSGSLVENYTQAVARDLMVGGMLRTEAAGYENLLTCHDEVTAEVDDNELDLGTKSLEHFISLMCEVPSWGAGAPIGAEGFIAKRYRK